MKRYIIWANCNHDMNGEDDGNYDILEFGDDVSQETIELECAAGLDALIANNFSTGWEFLSEKDYQKLKRRRL